MPGGGQGHTSIFSRADLIFAGNRGKSRGNSRLVIDGLVPAIPIIEHRAIPIVIAGTSPAVTPRALPLSLFGGSMIGIVSLVFQQASSNKHQNRKSGAAWVQFSLAESTRRFKPRPS
jgi:hypothetical protein